MKIEKIFKKMVEFLLSSDTVGIFHSSLGHFIILGLVLVVKDFMH